MVGFEHSLKISAPQFLRFGIDSVLKILNERITESVSNKGDCRTAPVTPGLLNILWILYTREVIYPHEIIGFKMSGMQVQKALHLTIQWAVGGCMCQL